MNTLDDWQARNAEYLAAALAWLRLKLESAVRRAHGAPAPADEAARLQAAHQRLDTASASEPVPALQLLARRLGLSAFERDLLLLCVAMELDTRTATLCAGAQEEPRPYPTYALALSLFDEPAWEALSPERPLRYWRLIEINQPAAQPLTSSALRADERIVSFIKGLNYLDDRLAPLTNPVPGATLDSLPGSQRAIARQVMVAMQATSQLTDPIVLVGRDRDSKRQLASAMAGAAGLQLCRLPAEMLPSHAGELETMARLWQRESLLLPIALYLDAHEMDRGASGSPDAPLTRLARFVTRSGGLMFISTRDPLAAAIHPLIAVDVDKPTPAEQQAAWLTALGSDGAAAARRLAGQFNLNRNDIATIAVRARKEDSGPIEERVRRACRLRTRPTLERLAERIDAKATWDDIVLPKTETALLQQIAAQVDARARVYDDWGFRDAHEPRPRHQRAVRRRERHGQDHGRRGARQRRSSSTCIASICPPWSASTSARRRRTCARLFDAAEDGGAILFFDEADALFGKRSEVKDSHDRYANIEINYLLQRMEAYRGLAILATNMKSALDSAFMRRLRFIVNFPFPRTAERRRSGSVRSRRERRSADSTTTAWPSQPHRRQHPQHRAERRVRRGACRHAGDHGHHPRGRAHGIPQDGSAGERRGLSVGRVGGAAQMNARHKIPRERPLPSKIRLHIDQIVFEGVAFSSSDAPEFQRALETHLVQLLSNGVPGIRGGTRHLPLLEARPLALAASLNASELGTQIAESLSVDLTTPAVSRGTVS